MNTVITHFYNEEYLLPFWINHHKKLFDYGIMINYHSTDRSLEICKELCPPHWKIVDSINYDFNSRSCDDEVKYHESTVDGFKIALTITEFLFTPMALNDINHHMLLNNINYIQTTGVCMVDMFPDDLPTYDRPLIEQKHHGMIRNYTDPVYNMDKNTYDHFYSRSYHNDICGKYSAGRHWLMDCESTKVDYIFTLKYKYCPWNEFTIKRIQQFASKIPFVDINYNIGVPHLQTENQHQYVHNHFLMTAHDLKEDTKFLNAYNYSMGL